MCKKSSSLDLSSIAEKNTLNIYVNGKLIEESVSIRNHVPPEQQYKNLTKRLHRFSFQHFQGEFVDGGTETTFIEDGNRFVLSARTSGNKREGIVHSLEVNGATVGDSASSNSDENGDNGDAQ